jgi:hypothetical protein
MHADPRNTTRRDAIKLGLLAGAGLAVGRGTPLFGEVPTRAQELITRPIPGTGERLPVLRARRRSPRFARSFG